MQSDGICVLPEQLRHLPLRQPDGLAVQPHLQRRGPVLGPVDDNLASLLIFWLSHLILSSGTHACRRPLRPLFGGFGHAGAFRCFGILATLNPSVSYNTKSLYGSICSG